jgi:molecular chaperone DnaK (HSP70)
VPFDPKPAGAAVCVGFEYDHSGLVRVSVSDQGGLKVLKSHTLDLGSSTQSNSELRSLQRLGGKADDSAQTSQTRESADAPSADPAQLSNFLIEQVERQLAGAPSPDTAEIRAALGTYRELLAAGRDEEIDDLEEQLYTWLDDRKSPDGGRSDMGI